jgi:hypothetical protein
MSRDFISLPWTITICLLEMSTGIPSSSRALILTRSPSPPQSRPPPSVEVPPQDNEQWQPILHASNQVVLYNPHSHALSVTSASTRTTAALTLRRRPTAIVTEGTHPCPYCRQNLPEGFHGLSPAAPLRHSDGVGDEDRSGTFFNHNTEIEEEFESLDTDPAYHSRASDYFQLLAIANDLSSRTPNSVPSTPVHEPHFKYRDKEKGKESSPPPEAYRSEKGAFPADKMAEGYFKTFFQEECKLGMGASGSVYLCQVFLMFF